jgi:hypothetical protein
MSDDAANPCLLAAIVARLSSEVNRRGRAQNAMQPRYGWTRVGSYSVFELSQPQPSAPQSYQE